MDIWYTWYLIRAGWLIVMVKGDWTSKKKWGYHWYTIVDWWSVPVFYRWYVGDHYNSWAGKAVLNQLGLNRATESCFFFNSDLTSNLVDGMGTQWGSWTWFILFIFLISRDVFRMFMIPDPKNYTFWCWTIPSLIFHVQQGIWGLNMKHSLF